MFNKIKPLKMNKLQWFWIKLFGEKITSFDTGDVYECKITSYRYRGKMYVYNSKFIDLGIKY